MEFGTSGSVDGASEYDDVDVIEYIHDSDEEGCGLADAFKQFEAQAEKRTLELLKATDEQLFHVSKSADDEVKNAEEGSFSPYVYMSDQFRLKKPPRFQDWQQNFQYLQLTGSKMQEGESMEHIQFVPIETKEEEIAQVDTEDIQLHVEGFKCLQNPIGESRDDYEEIIMCDGLMEETLEHNENGDDGEDDAECGPFSPHNTHMEEVLDAFTMKCFSSSVAPTLASFYKTMLEKQQHSVRTAREERESAANRTVEEQMTFETAKQLRLDQEAQEEAARMEALEQQRQEDERKELARREHLLKQQLEENDEEEVKIKSLAYSHTREWYQPNKKCFSHRGRQLTYLKPVLQSKDAEDIPVADTHEHLPPRSSDRRRTRQSNTLKKPHFKLQKPQPQWVTGGALTNDKLCDISWVKKIARPPANSLDSPLRSRSLRKNANQKEDASGGVQLPIIPRPQQNTANVTSSIRKRSAESKRRHPC